jgi:predicted HAD superfamily hydrolase
MKLASFDIFDTALIRKCGEPVNIFFLLASRLYPKDEPKRDAFFRWRKNAERDAVDSLKPQNLTLTGIYLNFDTESFPEYSITELIEKEKQIELDNLIVNPKIRDVIQEKRSAGYTICFISDMYLDSDFLRQALQKEGCIEQGEAIYVSCEHKVRKSSGLLFDKVKSIYKPEAWEHFGDNKTSDYKIPERKGIRATLVGTSYTDAEQTLLSTNKKSMYRRELSILIGFQRAARISHGNNGFAEIGADFVASAYIPYVLYVLNKAQENGIARLYFLSRDGYILMKIAEGLQHIYPDIELKYLFVSRKSLFLPSLIDMQEQSFLDAMDKNTLIKKTVSSLLDYLGLNQNDLSQKYELDFGYQKIETKKQEQDFLDKLYHSKYTSDFKQKITSTNETLLSYFKQEGLCDGLKCGMVDVGWLGTSRLMINRILRNAGHKAVDFFYFSVRGDCLPLKYGNYYSFYQPNILPVDITFIIEEYYSSSPYPTIISYSVDNTNYIVPAFPSNLAMPDTRIADVNISVSKQILKNILDYDIIDFSKIFHSIALESIELLIKMVVRINISPFAEVYVVRKMTLIELFHFLILGKTITHFDKASLEWTCGRFLSQMFTPLHTFTGKIRRRLYLISHI